MSSPSRSCWVEGGCFLVIAQRTRMHSSSVEMETDGDCRVHFGPQQQGHGIDLKRGDQGAQVWWSLGPSSRGLCFSPCAVGRRSMIPDIETSVFRNKFTTKITKRHIGVESLWLRPTH